MQGFRLVSYNPINHTVSLLVTTLYHQICSQTNYTVYIIFLIHILKYVTHFPDFLVLLGIFVFHVALLRLVTASLWTCIVVFITGLQCVPVCVVHTDLKGWRWAQYCSVEDRHTVLED